MLETVTERARRPQLHPGMLEELFTVFSRLGAALEPPAGKEPTRASLEEARELFRRAARLVQMLGMESGMPPGMMEEFVDRLLRRRKPE